MVQSFPYKEGDIITIFSDWENEELELGPAQLVQFVQQGRSFILEDTYPESEQVVYNWQEWEVRLQDNELNSWTERRKIRYIDTVGIANSADDSDYDPETDPKLPKDKFIIFNDKEVF